MSARLVGPDDEQVGMACIFLQVVNEPIDERSLGTANEERDPMCGDELAYRLMLGGIELRDIGTVSSGTRIAWSYVELPE